MSRARGSGQADLRHPENTVYRCFLPDLTGFTGHRRAGPDPQHHLRADSGPKTRTSGEEFSLARADCEYRAPLSPRLARPESMVGEGRRECQRKVDSVIAAKARIHFWWAVCSKSCPASGSRASDSRFRGQPTLHIAARAKQKPPSGRRVQRERSPLWWGFRGTPQPLSAPLPAQRESPERAQPSWWDFGGYPPIPPAPLPARRESPEDAALFGGGLGVPPNPCPLRSPPSGRVQRGRSPFWWGFGGTPQPLSAPLPAREVGGVRSGDGRMVVRPYKYGTGATVRSR